MFNVNDRLISIVERFEVSQNRLECSYLTKEKVVCFILPIQWLMNFESTNIKIHNRLSKGTFAILNGDNQNLFKSIFCEILSNIFDWGGEGFQTNDTFQTISISFKCKVNALWAKYSISKACRAFVFESYIEWRNCCCLRFVFNTIQSWLMRIWVFFSSSSWWHGFHHGFHHFGNSVFSHLYKEPSFWKYHYFELL